MTLSRLREKSTATRPTIALPLHDPWLFGVFLLGGGLLGGVELLRLLVEVPVASNLAPGRQLVFVQSRLFPVGTDVLSTWPGTLTGIKPLYLLPVVALLAVESVVAALVTAVFCWRAVHGEWQPPRRSVLWVTVYALGVAAFWLGSLVVRFLVPVVAPFDALVVLPLTLSLFLTPAVIVLEQASPVTGMRRAVVRFRQEMVTITSGVLFLALTSYLLTGLAPMVGLGSPAVFVLATVLSNVLAGTFLASLLVVTYDSTTAASQTRQAQSAAPAQPADE